MSDSDTSGPSTPKKLVQVEMNYPNLKKKGQTGSYFDKNG